MFYNYPKMIEIALRLNEHEKHLPIVGLVGRRRMGMSMAYHTMTDHLYQEGYKDAVDGKSPRTTKKDIEEFKSVLK